MLKRLSFHTVTQQIYLPALLDAPGISPSARYAFEAAYLNYINTKLKSKIMEAFLKAEHELTQSKASLNQFEDNISAIMMFADVIQNETIAKGHAVQHWNPAKHGLHAFLAKLAILEGWNSQPVQPIDTFSLSKVSATPETLFPELARWILSARKAYFVEEPTPFSRGTVLNLQGNRQSHTCNYTLAWRKSGELVAYYQHEAFSNTLELTLHPNGDGTYRITLKWDLMSNMERLLYQAQKLATTETENCHITFSARKAA